MLLGGFDLAIKLAHEKKAIEKFGLDLAPEIEAGEPHDMTADIWALGMISKQLLSCVQDNESINDISGALIGIANKMVQRNPSRRPRID